MKCKLNCNYKEDVTNPDGICGFCHLAMTMNTYVGTQKAAAFVKNMPKGALEQSKLEFIEERTKYV